ncbi:hypothetical protein OG802_33885 [Streptomyces sp. NBC_00704]|uniref:hypothetical protein n=1 Tax=Streptomyces sp. NBC_00704 TaxID=2975809 RepID=UPI002E35524F|nr:hypothetical protein [Streptomyces sp. NBC_00704]
MTVKLTVPTVITHPGEAALPHRVEGVRGAPVRRTPGGWSRGPHDTPPHLHARRPVTGFRLARAEA